MTGWLQNVCLRWGVLALAPVVMSTGGTSVAGATDFANLGADLPEVRFDVPRAVVVREAPAGEDTAPFLANGERLVTVELPVSVVVARGEVDRVGEVVIEVDGADAGLTVHDYSPATRLASEYAGKIQVESKTESDRHLEGSLGGLLPSAGGAVAQLAPSISAGRAGHEAEVEKHTRLAPKEAIVVAGAINRRQGVLFKFRPSSQTTLEGEHRLTVTFVAPEAWRGGELSVACAASGQRKVLFVKQRKIWGAKRAPVELRLATAPTNTPKRRTAGKPVVAEKQASDGSPTASGPASWRATPTDRANKTLSADGLLWKRRVAPAELTSR